MVIPQRADKPELNTFAEIIRKLNGIVDETDHVLGSRALFVESTAKLHLYPQITTVFVVTCGSLETLPLVEASSSELISAT
ncbi:hypothetical protein Bca4012_099018 [Brassica carinata]